MSRFISDEPSVLQDEFLEALQRAWVKSVRVTRKYTKEDLQKARLPLVDIARANKYGHISSDQQGHYSGRDIKDFLEQVAAPPSYINAQGCAMIQPGLATPTITQQDLDIGRSEWNVLKKKLDEQGRLILLRNESIEDILIRSVDLEQREKPAKAGKIRCKDDVILAYVAVRDARRAYQEENGLTMKEARLLRVPVVVGTYDIITIRERWDQKGLDQYLRNLTERKRVEDEHASRVLMNYRGLLWNNVEKHFEREVRRGKGKDLMAVADMALMESLGQYEPRGGNWKMYLERHMKRRLLDYIDKTREVKHATGIQVLRLDAGYGRALGETIADPVTDPEGQVHETETRRHLEKALSMLNKQQREIALRHVVEGESCADMMHEMGMTREGVRYHVTKALDTMRLYFAEQGVQVADIL
jgi:RNA polymerase sigma factor (sigma-70 family)